MTKNCESELKAAIEYHDNYRDEIDRALGQPRDLVDGPILEEHLQAIRLLKAMVGKGHD